MPSGSPVVSVGVNKSANAAIYTMKILANEFPDLQKKLKTHKSNQHNSVMEESDQLKKQGLSKFAKKKFK
jgi:5-(carboxyamino)imidazole ribonucleotide mutase